MAHDRMRWVIVAAAALIVAAVMPYAAVHLVRGDRDHVDEWQPGDPIALLSSAPIELPAFDGEPLARDDPRPLFALRTDGVWLGSDRIVPLPPADAAAASGFDAQYKRGSAADYYVVPLGSVAMWLRDRQKRAAREAGQDPYASPALIASDVRVPQRALTEVMYTLGQCEFGRFVEVGRDGRGRIVVRDVRPPSNP